jgi:tetratricopeptide (TPR) repeat protein
MTLPLVLLVLDVYPLRRLGGGIGKWFGADARRVWLEKLPFFIAAAAAGAVALTAQQKAGALVSTETHDLAGRMAQGLYGITFYMVKTLQPTDLAPLYEIPSELDLFHWRIIFAAIVFLLFSLGFFAARRRWPAAMASWIAYLLLLAPVLGIAQSGLQLVADRYSYLSCMVWAILLAAALPRFWWSESSGIARSVGAALLIGIPLFVLFWLGILTWKQTGIWHDSERLWSHALAVSPSGMANLHVGRFIAQRGDLAEGEKHLRRAVEFNPKNDVFQSNLALVLARQGNLPEATVHFYRALEINPGDPATLNNMGITLAQQGKLDEAIQHFQRSLEIKPNDASGHTNMANLLLDRGDVDGATKHLRVAIEIDPADADNHNSLAIISAKRGNLAEATGYLRRVVELKPADAAAANNLAITLAKQGRLDEAAQRFEAALRIDPNFAEAHAGLARVLATQKKPEEAMRHYQEALRILKAQQNTATSRDGKQ